MRFRGMIAAVCAVSVLCTAGCKQEKPQGVSLVQESSAQVTGQTEAVTNTDNSSTVSVSDIPENAEVEQGTVSAEICWIAGEDINKSADIITTDTDYIKLRYDYSGVTEGEYRLDDGFTIQKLEYSLWDDVRSMPAGSYSGVLGADNASYTEMVAFNDHLSAGHYRVAKTLTRAADGEQIMIYTEFDVKQSTHKPDGTPYLTKEDIRITITNSEPITTDTPSIGLLLEYIGGAEKAEYIFGQPYKLKKLSKETGGYETVKFIDNLAFHLLGYMIGTECPQNTCAVSLDDSIYAEPLTAGSYIIEKKIDDVLFEIPFEMTDAPVNTDNPPAEYPEETDQPEETEPPAETASAAESTEPAESAETPVSSESGEEPSYEIDSENGNLTLSINEITENGFMCRLPWPYPAVYEVVCDVEQYSDLCVGDNIEVEYSVMYKPEEFSFRVIPKSISVSDFQIQEGVDYKPVIYLYPAEETEVSVKLRYNGELIITEPQYKDGWNITASPDGTLTAEDGEKYPYLFWEGEKNYDLDLSCGFCVSGADTAAFLREKLEYLGLSDREAADFMEFWLPHMEGNPYNLIRFHGADYTDNAELFITPAADTLIRVYMSFTPCAEYTQISPQQLTAAPERIGFTVVEWGGCVFYN